MALVADFVGEQFPLELSTKRQHVQSHALQREKTYCWRLYACFELVRSSLAVLADFALTFTRHTPILCNTVAKACALLECWRDQFAVGKPEPTEAVYCAMLKIVYFGAEKWAWMEVARAATKQFGTSFCRAVCRPFTAQKKPPAAAAAAGRC
jgi:hypothetical protein